MLLSLIRPILGHPPTTDPRAPTKREDYWIHTRQTKAPMGLNVEGDY